MKLLTQAAISVWMFLKLLFSESLHMSKKRLREQYSINDKNYAIFRETLSNKNYDFKEVTLIIGFRLSVIGGNKFFHWLFQRISLLDTPVWVGFPGFKEKFWMVETRTQDYLGLYRYEGKENAKNYAEYICAILRPISTKGSVWYRVVELDFESYTKKHKV